MAFKKTLLATSIILTLSGCGQKTTQELVEEANSQLANNDPSAAIISLKNAIGNDLSNPKLRKMLGDIYFQQGQMAFAEKEYRSAIENGIAEADLALNLSRSMYHQDNFEEVVLYQTPDNTTAINADNIKVIKSLAYLRLGDVEKALDISAGEINNAETSYKQLAAAISQLNEDQQAALETLKNLTGANGNFAEALFIKARLETLSNDFTAAIDSYEKHLELLPNNHQIRLLLADTAIKNKDFTKAGEYADFILKLNKEQPFANQIKALVEFENKKFEQAQIHIEKAIQNGLPTDTNRLLAGLTAFQLLEFEQAHNHLLAISEQLPETHPAKKALAITQLELGYTLEASETLSDIDNISEQDSQMFAAASYELIKAGEIDKAKETIEKVESAAENNPLSLTQVGMLKLTINELDGLTDLEKATEIDPNLPQARMALAAAYIQTKAFDKSLELADSWINESPDKVDGYNLKGITYTQMGEIDNAEQAFKQALELSSINTASLMFFASKATKENKLQEAQEHLKTLIKANPRYRPALTLNYRNAVKLGDTSTALAALVAAYENSNNDIRYASLLARAYYSEQQFGDAIELLKSVDSKSIPAGSNYWLVLASSYRSNGQSQLALNALADWTNAEPKSEQAWLRKLSLEEQLKKYNDALNTTQKALVQLPDSQRLRLTEANLLVSFNRDKDAQNSLNQASEEAQKIPFAQKIQGHIYALQGKNEQAIPLLLEGYKSAPALRNASLVYVTYKALNQQNKGFEFLEAHIVENTQDLGARTLIANEYLATNPNKAIDHYHEVIKQMPNNVLALNNAAYLLSNNGELPKADEYATKAVELAPENAQILDTAGVIKIALNDKTSAIKLLSKAVELAPNNAEFKANLKSAKAL